MQQHVDTIASVARGLGEGLGVARAYTDEVPTEIRAEDYPALIFYTRDCIDLDVARDGSIIQGEWAYQLQLASPVDAGKRGGGHEAATGRWEALIGALSPEGFQVVRPRGQEPVVRQREGLFGTDDIISCILTFTKTA